MQEIKYQFDAICGGTAAVVATAMAASAEAMGLGIGQREKKKYILTEY